MLCFSAAARHEDMSFNQKGGAVGHQSSISAYSNNKVNVEESFH